MIELPIEVTPDGGEPFRVVATSRDIRQWERVHKGFVFANMASLSMTDLYGIAYWACKRRDLYAGTLAEFETGHDLDAMDDEAEEADEPDPTPAAP